MGELVQLGQKVDIRQGRYLSKEDMAESFSRENPVPVHGANGIIGWTDKAMYNYGVPLVTCRGSNSGMVLWADGPLWVSNNAMAILPSNGHRKFAYYALLNAPPYAAVSGSAQPQITRTALAPREYFWPDDEDQRQIANVLSVLDDKIEHNRRINETLEGMAQAIFRDWFVDFGPVRRKMAGATDPVAILGGLIPDPAKAAPLAALFLDTLGDNELPVGWEAGSLNDWATVNPESWTIRSHPAQVEYVDLSNTKWGTIEATEKLSWEDAPSRARRIVRPLDTIVATTRPGNGSYAYISKEGYTVSTGFAVLRPKQPDFSQLIYCAATSATNIERLAQLAEAHGGAYPAVNPSEVGSSPMPNCGRDLGKAFDGLILPMRVKIEHGKRENRSLGETRDYLLPRLMSGKVRVADAERMVG